MAESIHGTTCPDGSHHDWRYWAGTPHPYRKCEKCGATEAVGMSSYDPNEWRMALNDIYDIACILKDTERFESEAAGLFIAWGCLKDEIKRLRECEKQLEANLEELDALRAATRDGSDELKTFCPQCGANVAIDEDGCCAMCGNGAEVTDKAFISLQSIRPAHVTLSHEPSLREIADAAESGLEGSDEGLMFDALVKIEKLCAAHLTP